MRLPTQYNRNTARIHSVMLVISQAETLTTWRCSPRRRRAADCGMGLAAAAAAAGWEVVVSLTTPAPVGWEVLGASRFERLEA